MYFVRITGVVIGDRWQCEVEDALAAGIDGHDGLLGSEQIRLSGGKRARPSAIVPICSGRGCVRRHVVAPTIGHIADVWRSASPQADVSAVSASLKTALLQADSRSRGVPNSE